MPSDDGGQWQASIGGSEPGSQCADDHHRLLHAGDDRLRPAEKGQGVAGAAGDPCGDHVVRELGGEDPAVPGGGRRGLSHQAGAGVGCVAPLQQRQEFFFLATDQPNITYYSTRTLLHSIVLSRVATVPLNSIGLYIADK